MTEASVFYFIAIGAVGAVAALLIIALIKINRILGRVDTVTKELSGPVKHAARALEILKESVAVAGADYLLRKVSGVARRATRKRREDGDAPTAEKK